MNTTVEFFETVFLSE